MTATRIADAARYHPSQGPRPWRRLRASETRPWTRVSSMWSCQLRHGHAVLAAAHGATPTGTGAATGRATSTESETATVTQSLGGGLCASICVRGRHWRHR